MLIRASLAVLVWPVVATAQPRRPVAFIDSDSSRLTLPVKTTSASTLVAYFGSIRRGEFEKSDEFARRIKAAVTGDDYALSIPRDSSGLCGWTMEYDVDHETATISLATRIAMGEAFMGSGPSIDCVITDKGSYPSTNSFGVRKTVRRARYEIMSAASFEFRGSTLEFPLPRERAARRPPIHVLAVIRPVDYLNQQILIHAETRVEPTLKSPLDATVIDTHIWSSRITFIVYNGSTGDVYFRGSAK